MRGWGCVAAGWAMAWWAAAGPRAACGQAVDPPPAALPLQYPLFVAFAPDGALLVGDKDAHALFRIAPDGKGETLYQGDPDEYRTFAHHPRGLACDRSGAVWWCDPATMDLVRLGPDRKPEGRTGRAIKELTGKPGWRGELPQPEGVALAADGTAYVSDMLRHEIVKLAPGQRAPTTVAKLRAPRALLLDPDGALIVCTRGDDALVRVDPRTGTVTPILKGVPPGRVDPFLLGLAAAPGGGWLLGDNYNKCVWKVAPDGTATVFAGDGKFKKVVGVAANAAGVVAVADPEARVVWRLRPGGVVTPWATSVAPPRAVPPP